MVPDPLIGVVLHDRYRIIDKLGEGGMGVVYRAEHVHIKERLAVKLLRQEIVSNKEAVARFKQEAYSASSIKHPNIIRISDFGTLADGRIYLCMELLDGAPLNDMLEQPLDPSRILDILIKTGHGLAAAHADNIVHRDMKPENIFVTHDASGEDVPKILDFGIAKVSGNDGQNNLTKTGTIFGTPFYMAPEQALGQGVDHRADIYAMGVILYECISGSVPFMGESFMGILTKHITAEPEPLVQRAAAAGRFVPPGVADVVIRAMKKEPDERYPTMAAMVEAMVAVRRTVAGAGMSAYMAAHVPGPASSSMPVPGYPSPTPMPAAPGTPQPYVAPYGAPQSGPHSAPHSAQYPAPGDGSMYDMPTKKGKGGLIAAILLVLVVAGGIAAFVIISSGKNNDEVAKTGGADDDDGDKSGTQAGNEVAGDEGDGDKASMDGTDTKDSDTKDGDGTDTKDGGTKDGDGTDTKDGDTKDGDGTDTKDGDTKDGDGTDPVPVVEPVRVAVHGPSGAIVWMNDEPYDKVPVVIEVTPGTPVNIVLKRSGYIDTKATIDGEKKKVTISMKRKGGGGNTTKPPKVDPAADLE